QADLIRAKPVDGDIGILVVPESQAHCYAKNDSTEFYYKTIGGIYLQSYVPTTGKPAGRFEDGRIAVVDNAFGKGRTRLTGTFPGWGYCSRQDDDMNRFFRDLIRWAGETPHVTSSDRRIIARFHAGQNASYLWAVNCDREAIRTELALSERWARTGEAAAVRGPKVELLGDRRIQATIPARDVLIVRCA
ncbi:MAG: hypothetical protein ACOY3P_00445, partial [Planctomycetota bacterium]